MPISVCVRDVKVLRRKRKYSEEIRERRKFQYFPSKKVINENSTFFYRKFLLFVVWDF